MNSTLLHRPIVIWLLLMLATLAGFGTAQAGGAAFVVVMAAAWFKAWLIVEHFMELREAPAAWRCAFAGLTGGATAIILVLHVLA